MIVNHNDTRLTSTMVLERCGATRIEFHNATPGEPTDGAFIEAFNTKLRTECLNT